MRALELLRSAAHRAEEEEQSFSYKHADAAGIVQAYMALANFCDRRLRDDEQGRDGKLVFGYQKSILPRHAY